MNQKMHLRTVAHRPRKHSLLLICIMLFFEGCDEIQPPWSGWWWPEANANTCRLYNSGGPAEKYDQYVKAKTGTNPGFKTWEEQNHGGLKPSWYGHCHALAAASILFKEPTQPKTKLGVTFTPLDLKGLLTEAHYSFTTTLTLGQRYDGPSDDLSDPSPDKFHKLLRDELYSDPKPIAFDIDAHESVNTHVIFNYDQKTTPDPNDSSKTHVTTKVYYVGYGKCDPNYTGTVISEITYTYWIKGPIDNPTSGAWEGPSVYDHPDFLWRPGYALKIPGRPLDLPIIGEIGDYKPN